VGENGYRLSSINGNLTHVKAADQVVWTYTYDTANRMVHAEDGTGLIQADYGYDPFGRRLWKHIDNITTYFQYADEGLIGEFDAGGAAIRTYGYLPGTSTPLFLKQNGQYYWYRTDRLGIPQKLVASNGAVVWSGAYDAFGNCVVGVDTVENPLRLPGQYFDAETGLSYNLNRYYDPKIGRYLQPDPAGDGLNPYLYVGGNPVNAVDPNGLCALRMIGGVLEIKAGLALIPGTGGVGTAAAWMIIANGFDNLIAGARGLDGEYKQAGLESVIHWAVPNETAAGLLYMGSQIAIPWGGMKLAQWDKLRRQSRRLVELTVREAEAISTQGSPSYLSNSKRGPVLTGVMDSQTDEIFFGINADDIPENFHSLLKKRLDDYLVETGGITPLRAGEPGTHSEIYALNRALLARESRLGRLVTEKDLGKFLLHNRGLLGKHRVVGVPPPCQNCAALIKGITLVK
jgi:RHS repeat-associated protein